MDLALITATSGCSFSAAELGAYTPPLLEIESRYEEPTSAKAAVASSIEAPPVFLDPVTKTVAGTTTTLSVSLGQIANQGFNCALVEVQEEDGVSLMVFPISAPVIPPTTPAPTAAPAAPPAPAPAVLSFPKAKPLKVKAGTWKTVHVKVNNTGATATAQGTLRVKAGKGVLVKPEVQKLPILPPGGSFTLSVRVKLTEAAKTMSSLAVTGTAAGVTSTGSIVLKLKS